MSSLQRVPSRRRRARLALAVALFAALPASAQDAPLDACRAARDAGGADALATCRASVDALRARGDDESAFEALMHVAELATRTADTASAEAALDDAQRLLPHVNDPLAAHRLHRRRGLLAYHLGKPAQALGEFLEALAAATAGEGTQARAVSHNDLGVVYQKLGDYPAALDQFQRSLELKQGQPEADLAATLANIGSLDRKLGDTARAGRMLDRALAAQLAAGQAVPAARTREERGELLHAQGDDAAAAAEFEAAWQAFDTAALPRERMRVALRRAELEHARGDAAAARSWLARGRTDAAAIGRDPLLAADLLDLALAPDTTAATRAADLLAQHLPQAEADDPALAAQAWLRLADHHAAAGDSAAALAALRAHLVRSERLAQARHDDRLAALRVRFDLATLEAERDRLELVQARQAADIERGRFERLALVAGFVLLLGVLVVAFQRRAYRQRVAAAAERARLEQRIAQARAAADALRADVRSLAWLLDRGPAAALVFDAAGIVRAITPAAAARLGHDAAAASGRRLDALLGTEVAAWAQARIEQASLDASDDGAGDAPDPSLQVERIAAEEEFGVLTWHDATTQPQADAPTPGDGALVDSAPVDAGAPDLRPALVHLMQTSLALWERITRKTRIDLAERSGVWRVTVDDGRLRVRALDRYLALDTLPERPRWREVLRTAYFVLAELPLTAEQRADLDAQVEGVQRAAARRG